MIHLPVACNEGWNNMTPVNGGRHCHSCNKVLPDFSEMSDEELKQYFRKANGQVCGRFRHDQISDGNHYGNWQFYFRWKTAVALLLVGSVFLVSCRRRTSGVAAYHENDVRTEKPKTEKQK